jgi:hypothetical protein
MCECTPKTPARYCGQPGCRDPRDVEIEQLRHTLALQQASYEREREIDEAEIERLSGICVAAHDRLLRGDDDRDLLALLATAWERPA